MDTIGNNILGKIANSQLDEIIFQTMKQLDEIHIQLNDMGTLI